MITMLPLISVCIPAYNRANVLPQLLESIVTQHAVAFEVVICEDMSPQRESIREIVAGFSEQYPGLIHYFENEENLGYDANLRRLIEKASGDYCLFMGNDDLMCAGALETVSSALQRYPGTGAVLRSYALIDDDSNQSSQVFRYFPEERFFPAGAPTLITFFKRMVVLPGIVLHRESCQKYATSRFDGTLLYQLYLVGRILAEKNGVFLPQVIVLYRTGGVPDFGVSSAEQGKFVPTQQTPASSLHFMQGMLEIARALERDTGLSLYESIQRDLSNYSYPFIAIQRKQSLKVFVRYCLNLARLGFGRYPMFYVYVVSLLILGERLSSEIMGLIKRLVGHTPVLGRVYQGQNP